MPSSDSCPLFDYTQQRPPWLGLYSYSIPDPSVDLLRMTDLADLRKNYMRGALSETDVDPDPIAQFQRWLQEALQAGLPEPNAMTLATVNAAGQPSARIVLIKNVDPQGFIFFTNYQSHKGQDLADNPRAALLFHWVELERQVRIEGDVEKITPSESDAYYASRPLDSRIGAWASKQSQAISGRTELVARAAKFSLQYGFNPPRPPFWGGYRVKPLCIEFWQGRPSRLHDRIQFQRQPSGDWNIVRLAP